MPIDDPDLNPLWEIMNDLHLPIMHHSFFYEPPYFPGARDIWGNSAIARTAAHPWGALRCASAMMRLAANARFLLGKAVPFPRPPLL